MSKSAMEVYSDGRGAESDMEECIHGFGVCGDWTFDDYDCSVEMLGTRDGWLPSDEQRAAMRSLGILRAYISYASGGAVLVNNVTGASGACSDSSIRSDRSALVAALQSRLAAAEALLGDCRRAVRHARQDCAMLEDQVAWDAVLARIDAHLTPAPTKPEGGEVPMDASRLERAAKALREIELSALAHHEHEGKMTLLHALQVEIPKMAEDARAAIAARAKGGGA